MLGGLARLALKKGAQKAVTKQAGTGLKGTLNRSFSPSQMAEMRLKATSDKIYLARQNGRPVHTLKRQQERDRAAYWKAKKQEK